MKIPIVFPGLLTVDKLGKSRFEALRWLDKKFDIQGAWKVVRE